MSKNKRLNQTKTYFIYEQLNELERLFRMIEQQKIRTIEEDYQRLKRYERQAEYDEEVRQR
ncbi:hypothetical protein MPC59_003027 [Listeria monocytogenes]|nr:hypothetical protein [Listeria monocytogenes]EIZ6653596.1 hypothetical protein [Listeria monocytogenes]HDT8000314.1 hypothetical protein [Enterococcus faecalis]HDT8188118.1 hypothetical protein [Enterococcus faecalis]